MIDKFIGQTIANKYRIDSILRTGELGNTYRGMHTAMNRAVTLKILSPALAVDEKIVRRFEDEARSASNLSHPNFLNVNDFGTDTNGAVYIVYEGAEGATLKEEVTTVGQFTPERAVTIARQIASALSAAHANGAIHGNLSSANVLLAQTGTSGETAKVLDFGAVKSNDELADEFLLQNAAYLAPEQFTNVSETDARSDIYSLGVILYEMLAGEVPFHSESATETMLKHAEEPPSPLSSFRSDLPPALEPIVLKALAKNPEMRYQTADELIADLNNADQIQPFVAPKVVAANASGNNIWKTAFVVLAGISLLAIGLIYATSVKQTNPQTAMQTDANGQPVQPINPATGTDEQNMSNMMGMDAQIVGNANSMQIPPGTMSSDGFGDGYNPWAGGVQPPPGAPINIPPGGQLVTVDANGSIFMPGENGQVILVPVPPANTAVNANVKPSPTPKTGAANANVAPPTNTATPVANTAAKPTPTTKPAATPAKPAPKPTDTPKPNPPSSTEKRGQSGTEQDAN